MTGKLELKKIDMQDDGNQLNVQLEVRNDADRALHFYNAVRGVKYDEATKTLRLSLSDRNLVEGPVRFIAGQPPLAAVDPGESEAMTFRVARFITQLGPPTPGRSGPTLVQLPVHEASKVEVEISWSDKPFYPEPGKVGRTPVEQIRRWEQGVLTGRMERDAGGPVQKPGPKRPEPPKKTAKRKTTRKRAPKKTSTKPRKATKKPKKGPSGKS